MLCPSFCSCLGSLLGKCSCPISVILFDFCFVKGGAQRPQGLGGRSRQSILSFPFLLFPSFLLNSVIITLLAQGSQNPLPKQLCLVSACWGGLCWEQFCHLLFLWPYSNSLTPGPHHVATAFPDTPQLPASAGSQCCSSLDHCPEGMTVLGTGHTALNTHAMCSTGAQEDLGERSGRGLNALTISYNLVQQLKAQPGDSRVRR